MTQTVTLTIGTDQVEVDGEALSQYLEEAFDHLKTETEAKEKVKKARTLVKETVEAASDTLKLPKKLLNQYFRARYTAETAVVKALGETFAALDEAAGQAEV